MSVNKNPSRIIEKVKKCSALADSANEHEALAAHRKQGGEA